MLMLAVTKPWIPMVIAVFLYIWIAVATYHIKQPGAAIMWLSYAVANSGMLYHMLYEIK